MKPEDLLQECEARTVRVDLELQLSVWDAIKCLLGYSLRIRMRALSTHPLKGEIGPVACEVNGRDVPFEVWE